MREERKNEELEVDRLKNFEKAAYGGGDSKPAPSKSAPGIAERSKKIKKDDALLKRANQMVNKYTRDIGDHGELDITPRLGAGKKKQEKINLEKMEKGFSKTENHMNKEAFKEQPRMRNMLKEKIEKKKKLNMKKINTIKIKKHINK